MGHELVEAEPDADPAVVDRRLVDRCLVAWVRERTERDLAQFADLSRAPAWRRRVANVSGDAELLRSDTLLRCYTAYMVVGHEGALDWYSLVSPTDSSVPPTRNDWAYWTLGGLIAAGSGDLEGALDMYQRAASAACSLQHPDLHGYSLAMLGYVYEKLDRFDESLSHLNRVIRGEFGSTNAALCNEILASSFDRFRLFDLSGPQWAQARATIPASKTYVRTRIMVGSIRSQLHAGGTLQPWVDDLVAEVEDALMGVEVGERVASRAGIVLGWWHAAHHRWAEARRYLDRFGPMLSSGRYPAYAIEAAQLEAIIAVHEGRYHDVMALPGGLAIERAQSHAVEALLRSVIEAQQLAGEWEQQDATYERLDRIQSANRRHRDRVAHFAHRRKIEALEASHRSLREAIRDRDGLMGIVSHDLRGPLATMSLDLGRIRTVTANGELRPAQLINRAYDHMVEIVDHLSLVDEVEGGSLAGEFERLDLRYMVSRACARVRCSVVGKGQSLVWEPPAEPVWCVADQRWLSIILDNFLSNASKFCERGAEIVVEVTRCERAVVVVSDTGPGFDPSEAPALFQRYSRLSAAPTAGETSSGLGLYLAAELARRMGAIVEGRSPGNGRGSSFSVALPT